MITAQDVTDWLDLSYGADDLGLDTVCQAVNAYVESLPSIDRRPDGGDWAETTRLGAVMLAARLYRRRNSPGGLESVGEAMTYVSRFDSDIDRLLNLNSYRRPVIG